MKYLITIAFCSLFFGAGAQLAGTQWTGSVSLPDIHPVLWSFEKDTVKVFFTDSSAKAEIMIYKDDPKKKVASFIKISGSSPCDDGSSGIYSYVIADDKLTLMVVEDACIARSSTIKGFVFTRVK